MAFSFSNVCRNVLPAGTYKVQISDIKFKSNDKGTYNMEVHYVVVDGAYEKRTLIDTIYEKSFSFRLKPFLTALGIDLAREFETAKELYEYGVRAAKGKIIMAEFGTNPNVMPKTPRIDDIAVAVDADLAPIAEISDDDMPF